MPYIQNDQIRIHYHAEGRGPALVLQHGVLGSLEDWHSFRYVTGLETNYRLILIDQRGHGYSDKPYDPASYSLEQNTADIIAVLDDLKIPRASYFGYSMGGWIGFGVAKYASERFDSIIIGGAHPFRRSSTRSHFKQGLQAFLAPIESQMNPGVKRRWMANDLDAILALAKDRPDLSDSLPTMNMPCLIYAGDADPLYADAKQAAEQLSNGTFFSLPGLGHYMSFVRSDLVLPKVREFLTRVNSS